MVFWHSVDLEQTIKCFFKKICSTPKAPQAARVIEATNDTWGLQLIKKQYEIKSSIYCKISEIYDIHNVVVLHMIIS